ncbi:hypothetical protein BRARA_A02115 [Brassica rapa]|uniref:Agenet domain-containing protein n=1 Tax=Brassica campestris TaxID=3711 RepID=A0A398AVH1_BRACM|nr:hypothetical protein BRARA_A02115 [Brassica rapa]
MPMKKGDEIEVSSHEEGLKGSWFRAILETSVPVFGNIRLHVSFLSDDGSNTRKITYRRYIRPVPPENLFTEVDFKEGCVVEASQRDHEKAWVYFNSPPDLFQIKTEQLREHFDRVTFLYKTLTFSCGTMVEVNDTDDDDEVDVWVPSVIVKVMGDKKSFIVKPFKHISWDDGETPKPNRTVGLSSIRLTPVHVSVERSYGLMESVEVFLEPGWRSGTVTSLLCENRYTVCLNATNESLVFKHDALRPSGESITTLVLQNTSEVNAAITPQMSLSSGENGEKELSETATESVSSLAPSPARSAGTEEISVQPVSDQSGLGNHTTQENESSGEVNNNQKRKREHNLSSSTPGVEATTMVLPFAKKSHLWKELETMENFKDLEPDVSMSQLDSLKVSFAELEKHGFDVSAPLARINKLKILVKMEHRILELERQQLALKEQRDAVYQNICQMESFAKDNGIELDNLESEFKATSSAPWYIFFVFNF